MAILAAAFAGFVLGALQSAVVELALKRGGRVDVGTWVVWGFIVAVPSVLSASFLGVWAIAVAIIVAATVAGSSALSIRRELSRAGGAVTSDRAR